MVVLYLVSVEAAAGKTALGAGLGKILKDSGREVGYLSIGDAGRIQEAFIKASEGKDVLIVEGMLGRSAAASLSCTAYEAARLMAAKVIAVEAYEETPCDFTESYRGFGENLRGIVLNKVPASQLPRVLPEAARRFGALNLLGAIPEDRTLASLTVGELAGAVGGKILNNAEKAAELVENYMLGAMVVDSGSSYFGRKSRKAAVVRGERPDMQLAALETPTRCLILSDCRRPPIHNVMEKAESRGVPVIATERGTGDIVTAVETALAGCRFVAGKKLPRLAALVQQHLNLKAVFEPLGYGWL